jgi:iron-regulated transporter 1
MPLILATMFPTTLLPSALFAFVSNLAVVIMGPQVGYLVDNNERIYVVATSLIVQNSMVGFCGVLFTLLGLLRVASPFSTWYSTILYLLSVCLGAIISLSQSASDVSIEKDWAIILAESDLSSTNAVMKRINLICEILAPLAFSIIMTFVDVGYFD